MEPEPILFVYHDSPGSRKQARKHVSRVVRGREHRQRYRDPFIHAKIVYARPDVDGFSKGEAQNVAPNEPPEANDITDGQRQYVCDAPSLTWGGSSAQPGNSVPSQTLAETTRKQHNPHVELYFSAARSDPFRTLPVILDAESAKCLDHFNTSMPYLEFCVYEGAPLIPSRHVAFRSALETPAALHAIIATGATHLASLYGLETSPIISHHIGQALELLRNDILSVNKANWARIAQSMTEVAAGDDFRGQIQNSRVHLNGLRELMATFGGIEKLHATPRIQLLTCYVLNGSTAAYFPIIQCTRGTYKRLRGTLCERDRSSASPRASDLIGIGIGKSQGRVMLELSSHVHDFCAFMNKIAPRADAELDACIRSLRKILPHYFYPENKLRKRLSIAALDQERFGGLGPKGNHRMSCLFTIIVKLLRLAEAGDHLGLTLHLEKLQYLSHPNLRLLQFILMQDGTEVQMHDAAMSWEVVRLMQIYKIMGEEWRRTVNATLVGFLNNEQDEDVGDGYVSSESPDCERFTVAAVMDEVLSNLVQVVAEQPLLGATSNPESAPSEDVWEIT